MANNDIKLQLSVGGAAQVVDQVGSVNASLDKLGGMLTKTAHYGAGLAVAMQYIVPAMQQSVRAVIGSADAITTLNNQLKLATGSAADAKAAFGALFDIAQRGRVSFTELGGTFASISRAGQELGISQQRLLTVTESIANAMAIGGGSAQGMQAALVQLGQGLSSGTLRGEELNSVMEQAPRLAQALAEGLGVTTGSLRKMGEQGLITAEQVIVALEKAGPKLLIEVANAEMTVGQSMTVLENSAVQLSGILNEATGLTKSLSAVIVDVSDAINQVGKNSVVLATLTTVGETVRVVWSDVAFVFKQTGAEIGGISAQIAAVLSGNFAGAATIRAAMVSDAKAARAALDAYQKSVLTTAAPIENIDDSKERRLWQLKAKEAKDHEKALHTLAALRDKLSGVPKEYTDTMKQVNQLHAAGVLVGKDYTAMLGQAQALLKKSPTGLSEAAKGLALYNDLTAQASGLSADFAEKWAQLSTAYKGGKISTEQLTTAQAALLAQQTFAKDAAKGWADQARDSARAVEDSIKAYDREVDTLQKSSDSVAAHVLKLQDEEAAAALATVQNISLAEAIELVTIARLKEKQAAAYAAGNQEAGDAIKQEINNRRELAGLINNKEARDASTKAAKDAAEAATNEWRKAAEKINDSITDALMRGFESGKDFAAVLRDTVVNMFKTMVLRPIVSAIISPMGAAAAGMFGSGAAAAGQAGQGTNTLTNLTVVQTLKGMYDAAVDGFESMSLAVNNGFIEIGAQVGQYNAAAGTAINQSAAAAGSAAAYASGAIIGKVVGDAISDGYSVNGTGSAVVNIATVIGATIAGPIGAAIGGTIGGLFNRAFGMREKEVTGQGTRGTFSSGGFSGDNYTNYQQKGGWFQSDKNWTDTKGASSAERAALGDAFAGVRGAVMGAAASINLATDKIAGYSKGVDIAAGTSKEGMIALFTGMADEMAAAAEPGLAALAKSGETASATLNRLSASLTTTNTWLVILRRRTIDVSLAGADAASKLADLFGGLENFTSAAKAFYETYYTEGERAARSQEDMAQAMALVSLALPSTKDAYKDLANSLDLNTTYGRQAYAVLLAIAPEFAATSEAIARTAAETAKTLLATFSGKGQLVPVLQSASLAMGDLQTRTNGTTSAFGSINTVLLDSGSAVLTFGRSTEVLDGTLTASQQSAALLTDQIGALKDRADSARIDILGLSKALQSVNTETFVATITGVFESLATRIGKTISDISTERTAVREAALQIINPTTMGKAAIERGIAGVNTGLPSNASLVSAQAGLKAADAAIISGNNLVISNATKSQEAQSALASTIGYYKGKAGEFQDKAASYGLRAFSAGGKPDAAGWYANDAYSYNAQNNQLMGWDGQQGKITKIEHNWASELLGGKDSVTNTNDNIPAFHNDVYGSGLVDTLVGGNAALQAAAQSIVAAQQALNTAAANRDQAIKDQTTYTAAAKKAALDYAGALQQFALDASKSVSRLSKLREETVKYYEAQKALASLMANSASGLRSTVASYQYNRLSPEDQLSSLQTQFSSAYSMALSTSGETLAGYGDKLNSLLSPLLEKAQEVMGSGSAYNTLANTAIARAETVAAQLESSAPTNYAADSLAMLGNIDASLATLDASAVTAERLISDAVKAGSDKTATGLNAIVRALTGQTIPGYASGGDFAGGLRIVGENGPELEATGSSRIFNAAQTRSILGNGNPAGQGELINEIKALRSDNANMRLELRAIASSTARMAKLAERADQDGQLVRTDGDQPLHTLAGAWA